MKRYKHFILSIGLLLGFGLSSCVDDELNPEAWDKELPKELKEDYSIKFRMSLDPMGGNEFRTRASSDLKDLEDFVDLEKVRVFFFTCQYEDDGEEDEYPENGKTYDSGKRDYFLFESSSRWVSQMGSTSLNASKLWQITTPIFPYGNQDLEYNWDKIREALTTKPFKIVVMANRPPTQDYPKYDNYYDSNGQIIKIEDPTFDNQGPHWNDKNSWANNVDENNNIKPGAFVPTINDFHHCQYDPIYTGKNYELGSNGKGGSESNGNNVYDIIMKNPEQDISVKYKIDDKTGDTIFINQMGAISQWVRQDKERTLRAFLTSTTDTKKSSNYCVHPNPNDPTIGGIPMYGVQKFEPITNWAKGTPFNVSENQLGQDNSYYGKTISLLRSLVRLDLLIPKKFTDTKDQKNYNITLSDVCIRYPNVAARVLPLDAATPTDVLWSNDNCEGGQCEWFALQNQGPIIGYGTNISVGTNTSKQDVREAFWRSICWYYGAWRKWWDFNFDKSTNETKTETGVSKDNIDYFGNGPYPHIFNPCVQRNEVAWMDGEGKFNVLVDDPSYWHYVIYMGERYINDPSNFSNLTVPTSKICFFQFTANFENNNTSTQKTYQIAVTDYSKNTLVKNYMKGAGPSETIDRDMEKAKTNYTPYFEDMVTEGAKDKNNWNWVLLRNHIYRFQVIGFGSLRDDGTDGLVISTEERKSQDILYK